MRVDINEFRDRIFAKNETHCFSEREKAIDEFLIENSSSERAERYVSGLEYVTKQLSTPILAGDIILGRMKEGPVEWEMERIAGAGMSHVGNPFSVFDRGSGHQSLDYEKLLSKGLLGIVEELEKNADTNEKKRFAAYAARSAAAIGEFAKRYALAAKELGMHKQGEVLSVVPLHGAWDMQSALQSIWFVHFILSCVVGGRDFAFSRFDLLLLPFYRESEKEDTCELFRHFLLKCNEIGGMGTELHNHMPVPCSATNIYMVLGGRGADQALPISLLLLRAAEDVHMPQPVIALRMDRKSPLEWKLACAHAAQILDGQVSFYNDEVLIPSLLQLGFTEEQALNYTMSGCNRTEYVGHQSSDIFYNCPEWLLRAFFDENNKSIEQMLSALYEIAKHETLHYTGAKRIDPKCELHFNLESLFLNGCVDNATDIENGGLLIETVVHNLAGIATMVDSLAAIEQVIYVDKLLTLDEFREIVKNNFSDNELLRLKIKNNCPKYGNNDETADKWARRVGEILALAVRTHNEEGKCIHIPSLYALYFHHTFGIETGATPDGRKAGEQLSENQSPVHGCDCNEVTALLHSAASLPHELLGSGGLNLRLSKKMDDEILAGLIDAYFLLGGINIAPNTINRAVLIDAKANPEKHRNLSVRVVGYAEVFVNLPEYVQQELIDRTEYVS